MGFIYFFCGLRNLPGDKAAQTEHNSLFFFLSLTESFLFSTFKIVFLSAFLLKPLVFMSLFETIKAVRNVKSRPVWIFKIWFWIELFYIHFLFTENFYKCGIKTPWAVALIVTSSGKYARAISSSVSGSRKTRKVLKEAYLNKKTRFFLPQIGSISQKRASKRNNNSVSFCRAAWPRNKKWLGRTVAFFAPDGAPSGRQLRVIDSIVEDVSESDRPKVVVFFAEKVEIYLPWFQNLTKKYNFSKFWKQNIGKSTPPEE